ncbi:MAG: tetratricopeptide repeat protein [Candidatus Polarisedimenticolia bacterium]
MTSAGACVALLLATACAAGDQGASSASVEARERLRRGLELSRQGLYDGAAAELRRYVEAVPGDADARFQLGRTLLALARRDGGSSQEAIDELRRALELAPGKNHIRLQLAEALGETREGTHRPDEALALYRQVVERDPDDYEARLLMARWLAGSGLPDARVMARAELERVLDVAPAGSAQAEQAGALLQDLGGGR